MPYTPIGQFQIAFKLPHLNATFPSTFRIYKNQKHLKKVRAPTRRPTCCCCCCNNEPWGGLRRRKFVHPLTALIFIEHYVFYNSSVNSVHSHTSLLHSHTSSLIKIVFLSVFENGGCRGFISTSNVQKDNWGINNKRFFSFGHGTFWPSNHLNVLIWGMGSDFFQINYLYSVSSLSFIP